MKMNIDEKKTTLRCKEPKVDMDNKDSNTKKAIGSGADGCAVLVKTQRDTRIKLRDVNDHLTCFICKGYYIDATTIVECLHSFCRSCIIKRLQFKSYCPVCEMMINKAKPNIKPDKTLQDIVYKLVPGLHRDEMRRRRQFYNNLNENKTASQTAIQNLTEITPEQRGEDNERVIYNATDPISLSLEYCSTECDIFTNNNNNVISAATTKLKNLTTEYSDDDKQRGGKDMPISDCNKENGDPTKVDNNNHNDDAEDKKEMDDTANIPQTRYLQCPAGVSVRLLKKFLIGKFDINIQQFHIDILYKRVPLPDDYKLMDIAYIYSWKRSEPMRIFYRVMDIKYAMNRFDFFNPNIYEQQNSHKIKRTKALSIQQHSTATNDTNCMMPPAPDVIVKTAPTSPRSEEIAQSITVKSEPNIVKSEIKRENSSEPLDNNIRIKIEVSDSDEPATSVEISESLPKNVKIKNEKCDKVDDKQQQHSDSETLTLDAAAKVKNVNEVSSSRTVKNDKVEKSSENTKKSVNNASGDNKQQLAMKKVIENAKLTVKKLMSSDAKQEKITNNATISLSSILNKAASSPPKIFVDDENEREKSIFLNAFELTSTKSLSPNAITKKSPVTPPLSVLTSSIPAGAKQKTSPKKVSPKTQVKQKHGLLTVPNNGQVAQAEVRTKRKYTFKTRPMGKKARLELERQQQLTEGSSGHSATINRAPTVKLPPNSLPIKNVNTINKIVSNMKTLAAQQQQQTAMASPRVGEKRKIVSFKLPVNGGSPVVPEKRTNLNNSTSKTQPEQSSNNSLKSLFDNCNLNIPSSLSITLTEGPNDKEMSPQHMATSPIELNNPTGSRSPNGTNHVHPTTNGANFGGRRQSPPVNMYIEIFKIPDKAEQSPTTPPQPEQKPQNNVTPKVPPPVKKPPVNGEKVTTSIATSSTTTKTNATPPTNAASAKQQNIHKVTSLSTTNFVVHTTGIQSLGRKDAAAVANNNNTLSKTPLMPPNGAQLGRKILPKLAPKGTPPNGTFIPKLAESSKSATGFQKMFEEAIKRKEQAKAAQTLAKLSGASPSSNQQTINRKKDVSKTNAAPKNGTTEEKSQSNVVLDLSSPGSKKPNMSPRPPPLGSPLSIQTNQQTPSRLTMKTNKKITTNPQSNLISSTESSGSSNSPKSRCGTPLPALSVSVVPNTNTSSPAPTTALSPTTIQQQYNLTNLAQLQQVMLFRQQFELRNRLLQQKQQQSNGNSTNGSPSSSSSTPNGETLMQFENYMKSLQQQAALAAAAAAAQQGATNKK